MVPVINNRVEHGDADDETPVAPPVLCKRFWMKQPRIDWKVKLNSVRESAIVKWQKIVTEGPTVFEVSRYYFLSVKEGMETGTLFDCLKNIFASKSTNSRVGPMIRYIFYCESAQQEAFPLVESVVYAYMLDEESKPGVAPTYLRSFVSSLAFCHYVMGLVGARLIWCLICFGIMFNGPLYIPVVSLDWLTEGRTARDLPKQRRSKKKDGPCGC